MMIVFNSKRRQLRLLCAFAPLREINIRCASLTIGVLLFGTVCAENWDRFRGPNGAGECEARGIPSEWTEADYLWKNDLPGIGHSSPVIWNGRIYLTSADPDTAEQIVLAFDAASGEQ